jgi:hypothetical protein
MKSAHHASLQGSLEAFAYEFRDGLTDRYVPLPGVRLHVPNQVIIIQKWERGTAPKYDCKALFYKRARFVTGKKQEVCAYAKPSASTSAGPARSAFRSGTASAIAWEDSEAIRILTFHALMAPNGLPLALFVAVLWVLVFISVRPAFAGLFQSRLQ